MVVWGGSDNVTYAEDGGRYDPATDTWMPVSTVGEPNARKLHTMVWTGDEVIVWDGFAVHGGGRYDPVLDTWSAIDMTDAPPHRWDHTAVWTGAEMIVWGGQFSFVEKADGGRYDPSTDSWTATPLDGAPSARSYHTAVWTGNEMIVWSGESDSVGKVDGGRYNPVTDSWLATSLNGTPSGRRFHTAVWTGEEMIVWGGISNSTPLFSGGRYDPDLDTWTPTPESSAPAGRSSHSAVWTGKEMIIWGGSTATGGLNDGARFAVESAWTPLSASALQARYRHTAVWTGNRMIVWGGYDNGVLSSGGIYNWGFHRDDDEDGFSECEGDCDDLALSTYPGATELCDGDDQDCNAIVDDFAEPPEIHGLHFPGAVTLAWTAGPAGLGATHDIARGGFEFPVGSGSAETCLGSEPGDTAPATEVPEPGAGYWYLVRGRNACGEGTWGQSSDSAERTPGVCP